MRKVLAALVVLALTTTLASANGLGFFGSYWKPSDLDHGYGAGAKVQVEVVPNIFIEARGSYFHEMKDEEDDSDDAPKLNIIPVEGAGIVKLPVSEQVLPYAGGGIGYYFFDVADEPEGIDIEVDNKFGAFVVGGLELAFGESMSIFGEAKYTWLKDVDMKGKMGGVTVAEDEGDLSGFGASAGLLLRW